MAHQLLVAYSDVFSGMGSIAGGPFLCSNGSLYGALSAGMRGGPELDVARLASKARYLETVGAIADLENLVDARIWVFRGTEDQTVLQGPTDGLVEFCERFTAKGNVRYVNNVPCAHTMPTDSFDAKALSPYRESYISNVGFDAAGQMLKHLYGPLRSRTTPQGLLARFSQNEFLRHPTLYGMGETGLVYYPTAALRGKRCKLHVALHGCEQSEYKLGELFATHAGYNEWAEANDIIVLYPQAYPTMSPFLFNPKGSWDWFGMLDQAYCTRQGRQQCAILGMVDRLTGKQVSSNGALRDVLDASHLSPWLA
ncbi:hypothetical protein APY03_2486 [Variovorax sp. WDL1]|nr:hypothetical protein APY03_2486 [Variovorax sp. WDL1]